MAPRASFRRKSLSRAVDGVSADPHNVADTSGRRPPARDKIIWEDADV